MAAGRDVEKENLLLKERVKILEAELKSVKEQLNEYKMAARRLYSSN